MSPATNQPQESASVGKSSHVLHIDRRSHVTITGVKDVSSFHENEVILQVDSGEMVLSGQNLHIAKLLLEDGQLSIDGHVDGVLYQSASGMDGKRGFLRRLLK